MQRTPLVCVVDDDLGVCESLDGLLRSAGFAVRTFSSAEDLLRWPAAHQADCLILDYAMPGMNGLDLRRALAEGGIAAAVIFATAVADDDVWSQLVSSGAFAVFAKPLDAVALLEAVQCAVRHDDAR